RKLPRGPDRPFSSKITNCSLSEAAPVKKISLRAPCGRRPRSVRASSEHRAAPQSGIREALSSNVRRRPAVKETPRSRNSIGHRNETEPMGRSGGSPLLSSPAFKNLTHPVGILLTLADFGECPHDVPHHVVKKPVGLDLQFNPLRQFADGSPHG